MTSDIATSPAQPVASYDAQPAEIVNPRDYDCICGKDPWCHLCPCNFLPFPDEEPAATPGVDEARDENLASPISSL